MSEPATPATFRDRLAGKLGDKLDLARAYNLVHEVEGILLAAEHPGLTDESRDALHARAEAIAADLDTLKAALAAVVAEVAGHHKAKARGHKAKPPAE